MVHMGNNAEYMKRDKLKILLEILEIAKSPVKKTHILYKANINFHQLTRYLELLLSLEMLEETDQPYKGYRTTEKGRQMLNLFYSDAVLPIVSQTEIS
jgi:predicted transcriptional regulator